MNFNTGNGEEHNYVTRHEKIGLMCTQKFTTFLDFNIELIHVVI